MTKTVKAELARLACATVAERAAEITALLRFSGHLGRVGGRVVLESELDSRAVARRLRQAIGEVYGYPSGIGVLADRDRHGVCHLVRVTMHGESLARRTGLIDRRGRPVRGLPPAVVAGDLAAAAAVWRGAFLARGALTEPGPTSALKVRCPAPEAAMALVGAARRLGIAARAGEVRGAHRVLVSDGEAIGALLARMGAHDTALAWEERRMRPSGRASARRPANFDAANQRRTSDAAAATTARVRRALDILAEDVPERLILVARLRLEYRHASLEQLGRHAQPPLTKDAVAGRLRRLLVMADTLADRLGIPNTEAVTSHPLPDGSSARG